jgi:hypothetical protein
MTDTMVNGDRRDGNLSLLLNNFHVFVNSFPPSRPIPFFIVRSVSPPTIPPCVHAGLLPNKSADELPEIY